MFRAEGGSLRFWGPGLLSTSPAFSMSSASHSAGSSGWLAQKTGAGPTFQWAGKVDAICRSRSNRAKRPRAGCILRSSRPLFSRALVIILKLYHITDCLKNLIAMVCVRKHTTEFLIFRKQNVVLRSESINWARLKSEVFKGTVAVELLQYTNLL